MRKPSCKLRSIERADWKPAMGNGKPIDCARHLHRRSEQEKHMQRRSRAHGKPVRGTIAPRNRNRKPLGCRGDTAEKAPSNAAGGINGPSRPQPAQPRLIVQDTCLQDPLHRKSRLETVNGKPIDCARHLQAPLHRRSRLETVNGKNIALTCMG